MSSRYRVLHVIDSLDLGGAQVVLENLVKYGDRGRFEYEVAAMHGRGVFWERLQKLGVPMYSLSFHHKIPLYVPRLMSLCMEREYDVVHTHLLASNVIAKPIATFCGVPVRINHDHCNDKLADPRKWTLPADRVTNKCSTHVIAVSESTRRIVEEDEGVPAERTSTIYNGIDLKTYCPKPDQRGRARFAFGLPPNTFIVAGIGRLTYQKNFALFLDVAAEVLRKKSEAHFVIAGTGEDFTELTAQAERLGISANVTFLGMVKNMADLYPVADVLLLTSRYEGLPITTLEAMATGVPIVASDLDGMREVLRNGKQALLIPPGDCRAFSDAVVSLMNSTERARELSESALQLARDQFNARTMAARVEEIYLRYLPAL